ESSAGTLCALSPAAVGSVGCVRPAVPGVSPVGPVRPRGAAGSGRNPRKSAIAAASRPDAQIATRAAFASGRPSSAWTPIDAYDHSVKPGKSCRGAEDQLPSGASTRAWDSLPTADLSAACSASGPADSKAVRPS